MKNIILNYTMGLMLALLAFGCGKDNFEAPKSKLSGRVVYQNKALGVRGTNGSVQLQLWQEGFELRTPITVYVGQDGYFSSTLFDGQYKLITVSGNGPWQHNTDTVLVDVRGDTEVDLPVRPYFTLENVAYQLTGNELVATFTVAQVDPSKTIGKISLLVGDTHFVDLGINSKEVTASENRVGQHTLRMPITGEVAAAKALYARVAVLAEGNTEAVYDLTTQKIK